MTQTEQRRPAGNGTAPKLVEQTYRQSTAVAIPLPTVRALLLPRAGRRQMDAAIVMSCLWCRRSHLHRGYQLDGAVRESGCTPARDYVLAVAA